MELRHLRYFIKAAELLHFTKAAEALFISQPTLSTHIQQLEEELGTELFARVGRNVRLTETGQLLLTHAHQALRELEIASEEIDAVKGLLRGNLRIAALPLFSSALLPLWMAAFNSRYPEVRIQARSGTSEDIEKNLLSGDIDLGFGVLPAEHTELSVRELFTSEVMMVVSRKHPISKKPAVDIADLRRLPMAIASRRVATGRLLRNYFQELGIQPDVVVEYDDGHALLNIVKLGNLVTFLPVTRLIDEPDLCSLELPGKNLFFTAVAMWDQPTPASRAFVEIASAEVRNFEPAFL